MLHLFLNIAYKSILYYLTISVKAIIIKLKIFVNAVVSETGFLDCDAHAREPFRVLRVAGTCNHKMGQLLPVEVIERPESPEYDLKDLRAFVHTQEKRLSAKGHIECNERRASRLNEEQRAIDEWSTKAESLYEQRIKRSRNY